MPRVGEIAKTAMDAVNISVPGVIHDAYFERGGETGAYDPATGKFAEVAPDKFEGRAVVDVASAIRDQFPELVTGNTDKLVWLEGFSEPPKDGEVLDVGGQKHDVIATASDILQAGEFFAVLVR